MEEILEMPDNITYVSTLSGGLDSALATYLTMKLKPNSMMVLSSICLEHMDNYNFDNVKNIMNYLDCAFPYRIIDHRIGYFADRDAARAGRGEQTRELVSSYQAQGLISGMTLNPQELMVEGRDTTRDTKRPWRKKNLLDIWHYQPFINYDKKHIAKLYKQYNLQDLAELTVSCEAENGPRPCKNCWWCKEKYWGFGFY